MILTIKEISVAYAGTPKTSYEAGRAFARITYEQLLKRKEENEAQNRNHPASVGNGTGVNHDPVLHGHSKAEPIQFKHQPDGGRE